MNGFFVCTKMCNLITISITSFEYVGDEFFSLDDGMVQFNFLTFWCSTLNNFFLFPERCSSTILWCNYWVCTRKLLFCRLYDEHTKYVSVEIIVEEKEQKKLLKVGNCYIIKKPEGKSTQVFPAVSRLRSWCKKLPTDLKFKILILPLNFNLILHFIPSHKKLFTLLPQVNIF